MNGCGGRHSANPDAYVGDSIPACQTGSRGSEFIREKDGTFAAFV